MRRRIGLFLMMTGGMAVVLAAPGVRSVLSDLEIFRLTGVSVQGTVHLDPGDVISAAGLAADASLFDDLSPIEARIRSHPMILEAKVRRRPPSSVVLEVRERVPVGLLPTPALTPVDGEGRVLPIKPAGAAIDLPLVQPRTDPIPDGEDLNSAQVRSLAAELAGLERIDTDVSASVSEIALDAWGAVVLYLSDPRIAIRYWPPLDEAALDAGLTVLRDALGRNPGRIPVSVDLRFEDQAVVRYEEAGP